MVHMEDNKNLDINKEKKPPIKKVEKICIVLGVICIVLGLAAFLKPTAMNFIQRQIQGMQSNERDTSKDQVKIVNDFINIRELANTDSEVIGKVYKGDIYTVIKQSEDEKYEWYMIETSSGIIGYIASSKSSPYVSKMFVSNS